MNLPALKIEELPASGPEGLGEPKSDSEVFRDPAGQVVFRCWSDGGDLWVDVPRVSRFRLAGDDTYVTGLPEVGCGPDRVREAFHRIALPMMLQARGLEVVHGSAVRTSAGVAAFCADAGTGKSTTALALARREYEIWADDAVAIEVTGEHIRSVWLPFKIRLAAETSRFFDQDCPPISLGLARTAPRDGDTAPLNAIFLLRRSVGRGKPARVGRLDQTTALPALLEQAFCFELAETERKRRMAESYLALAARVPVFRLDFEPGLDRIDRVLDAIEATIRDHPAPA